MGIEFDGTYWHSFETMKKSKIDWPTEDVKNYHEIKDLWFSSKDIFILHVKEGDWNRNKEACVEKCLKFLGNKL
jgi:hypothetical protein